MSWRDNLRPASFRGVGFHVDKSDFEVGRRLHTSEFPAKDESYTEDLGRRARKYKIEGWIIGDDYQIGRDAMIAACENNATAGTLSHPFLGQIQVYCETLALREERTDGGRVMLAFTFVEAGKPPAPVAAQNTSLGALGQIEGAIASVQHAFANAFGIVSEGFYTVQHAIGMATALVDQIIGLAGLPSAYLGAVAAAFANEFAGGIAGNIGRVLETPEVFAAAVTTAIQAYGDAVVAYTSDVASGVAPGSGSSSPQGGSPSFSYSSSSTTTANDPTGGLAALASTFSASWAALPPATTPDRIAQGVNQQAMVDLVNATIALAVAQIFAQGNFDSSDAAGAARDQLIALFDTPVERAADTDADDLYQSLRDARAASLTDIAARGASLPSLVQYATTRPRTALSLAHLLYPDWPTLSANATASAQGWQTLDDIIADLSIRNAVIHPAFMPVSGQALAG